MPKVISRRGGGTHTQSEALADDATGIHASLLFQYTEVDGGHKNNDVRDVGDTQQETKGSL